MLESLIEQAPSHLLLLCSVIYQLQGKRYLNQKKSTNCIHYTEGIKGCGLLLEEKIQSTFLDILCQITQVIEQGKFTAG